MTGKKWSSLEAGKSTLGNVLLFIKRLPSYLNSGPVGYYTKAITIYMYCITEIDTQIL